MLYMLPNEYPQGVLKSNYNYYLPRTEHGSSLSACMYALTACKIGLVNDAYPLFMKSAKADLTFESKQWAGLVYIGGTHPASAGGAYMTMLWGFLGLNVSNNKMCFSPKLPSNWKKVVLNFKKDDKQYRVIATQNDVSCIQIDDK